MNADDLRMLVREERDLIRDPAVRLGLSQILVSPTLRPLAWDYGRVGETYLAWMVAQHPASGTGIAWCGHGFGPKTPWGLVSLTGNSMGMDSNWFPTLRDAYLDSIPASDLEIWVVVRRGDSGSETPLSDAASMEVAFRRRDEQPDARDCHVIPRRSTNDQAP